MTFMAWLRQAARKMWMSGARLRCPNCEQGHMFTGFLRPQATCEVCGVRFERLDGESIGGLAITTIVVPGVALVGFFLTDIFTDITFTVNAAFWGAFIILGSSVMYRHSRALWIAINYLTGGVYADETLSTQDEPQDTTEQREQIVAAFRRSKPLDNESESA